MHITQVQLSRAFACLLRLIADTIVDLRHSFESVSNSSLSYLRRSISAPLFLNVGDPTIAKYACLSSGLNRSIGNQSRSILSSKPLPTTSTPRLSSEEQAIICAGVGYTLAPVWAWLVSAMDSLEAGLRFKSLWSPPLSSVASKPSTLSASEQHSGDSGKPSTFDHLRVSD